MKVKDVIAMLEESGWYLSKTKGSHRQYRHPFLPGKVTVAGHLNDDLQKGTLNSILRQAKRKEVK